jgi:hypothetical protein
MVAVRGEMGMAEVPRPVFDPRGSEEARDALRATLDQLLRDIETIDTSLGRLNLKVSKVHEIDLLPVLDAIGRAADCLGEAEAVLEVVLRADTSISSAARASRITPANAIRRSTRRLTR